MRARRRVRRRRHRRFWRSIRQFIAGTGGKWIRPENDYVAYLVAWNYYIVDTWRFPLFDLPAMGYPEGGSVLFNDALPLTAAPDEDRCTSFSAFG